MPAAVVCPKCQAKSTGFFCTCGNDLREQFGVKRQQEQSEQEPPPRQSRVSLPNPPGMMLESGSTGPLTGDGGAQIAYGAFLLVIGLVVTGGSYMLAAPGGTYTIAFGAVGVGIWKMLSGLARS